MAALFIAGLAPGADAVTASAPILVSAEVADCGSWGHAADAVSAGEGEGCINRREPTRWQCRVDREAACAVLSVPAVRLTRETDVGGSGYFVELVY